MCTALLLALQLMTVGGILVWYGTHLRSSPHLVMVRRWGATRCAVLVKNPSASPATVLHVQKRSGDKVTDADDGIVSRACHKVTVTRGIGDQDWIIASGEEKALFEFSSQNPNHSAVDGRVACDQL